MSRKWRIGDPCWIYLSGHCGERSKGKVVRILDLHDFNYHLPVYLVMVETPIEPIFEAREGHQLFVSPVEEDTTEVVADVVGDVLRFGVSRACFFIEDVVKGLRWIKGRVTGWTR